MSYCIRRAPARLSLTVDTATADLGSMTTGFKADDVGKHRASCAHLTFGISSCTCRNHRSASFLSRRRARVMGEETVDASLSLLCVGVYV